MVIKSNSLTGKFVERVDRELNNELKYSLRDLSDVDITLTLEMVDIKKGESLDQVITGSYKSILTTIRALGDRVEKVGNLKVIISDIEVE